MSNKNVFVDPKLKAQKSSRNAFDLGHKRAFHASLGEILPIFHADVPAGGYIEINEQNQTYNLNPIIRPSFARVKEHIDYFAIPKVQLWSLYDNFITGQSQYFSSSLGASFLSSAKSQEVPKQLPIFDGAFLTEVLKAKYSQTDNFGFRRLNGSLKLLDLLGYGNYYGFLKDVGSADEVSSQMTDYVKPYILPMNFMNLLAYQKCYYSYYRNSLYEANVPTAFNIDWLPKTNLTVTDTDYTTYADNFSDIFTMHFRWLKKDYFMSVKPSVLPTSDDIGYDGLGQWLLQNTSTSRIWQVFSLPGLYQSSGSGSGTSNIKVNAANTGTSNVYGASVQSSPLNSSNINSLTGTSAIRFAFAYDKLLRRMRTAGATFDSQMLAQFGIKPVDYRHGDCYYLGGYTNRLKFSEVTQTGGDVTELGQFGANISTFSANSKKIAYHAKEDVIIMGIYSTSYDVDYPSTRYERCNLRRFRFDHYNPVFENLGLQALYNGELTFYDDQNDIDDLNDSPLCTSSTATQLKGYVKRYLEYKTSIDTVNGLLDFGLDNKSMLPWTTQYKPFFLNSDGAVESRGNEPLNQSLMTVNPMVLNDIVAVNYSGAWENDHFVINLYNNVKLVANMSIDGETF